MNSLIKTAVCSAIAGMFLAACGGGGGGSADAGNSGSGSGSGTGGPVTPPVVTAQADILMGETGGAAYLDGQGDMARFFYLKDITADSKGNIYVADGSTIRKITADGVVTTFAGKPGEYGYQDGTGGDARFKAAFSVVVDSQDNILVHDLDSVRKITPSGVVTTLASFKETDPFSPFNLYSEDVDARPKNMVIDSKDNIYLGIEHQFRIKKITPTGVVSDFVVPVASIDGVKAVETGGQYFYYVGKLLMDSNDNLHILDLGNGAEIVASPTGNMKIDSTFSKNLSDRDFGYRHYDKSGNLFRTDAGTIVRHDTDHIVHFYAGHPGTGPALNGFGTEAVLQDPRAMITTRKGELYFIDGNTVRKVDIKGMVTTIAGKDIYIPPPYIKPESVLPLLRVTGITAGPNQTLYIADAGIGYENIRQYNPKDKNFKEMYSSRNWLAQNMDASTTRPIIEMSADGAGNLYIVQNRKNNIYKIDNKGTTTTLPINKSPPEFPETVLDVTVSKEGKVFYIDNYAAIRQLNADGSSIDIAGNHFELGQKDGSGIQARFSYIRDFAIDSKGSFYVLEDNAGTIRKVSSNGQTSLYAGSYTKKGHKDGALTDAAFQCPASITVDDQDNLYVADTCDNAIRKISTDGKVSTIEPQWTTASGLKSRVIPAPRRVFWVNGKLHVFAGGDAHETGGVIFQITLN
ncbi:NHL domain-containing protein [Undibacterium luofuense]|uniref:Teneurin NHL domain-containing protein n=1 Tax=Undibacterium luofuense TaxID=2828733 RepID=A0A941DP52_9BURK|nr:hypothetical protein [Undibacterium luofuense]MBR7783480.1 hypothetical protein [Undibacterium luofuense]